jgi:hypothetical protein
MVVRTRVVVPHRPVVDVQMRMDAATVTVGMGVRDRHDTSVPPRGLADHRGADHGEDPE